MKVMENNLVYETVERLSSPLNYSFNEVAVILAAGHGKRIKSQRSKMLHKIWEIPTVERVFNACCTGIEGINIVVVVGIKALDVMQVLGKRKTTAFAYQEQQNGTGHAVQVALKKIDPDLFDGVVYVLPGDMGLIDKETMQMFRERFQNSNSDMMVLTGIYEGVINENAYGRIIRVKDKDENGKSSGADAGKVIEIMEYKDIQSLPGDRPYRVKFNNHFYMYKKEELIKNNEFNSGVYAFRFKHLINLVENLSSNNAQNEIYITDLISLFNNNGLTVSAVSPAAQHVVMGFNNKSVLKEMETVARRQNYERLKDIIEINDEDDFFIHEEVIEEILQMDKRNIPLDIRIGKGVYIGKGVKLNYNLDLRQNVYISGNVQFGEGITIWNNVSLSCFPGQTLKIDSNAEILRGNIIKGNVEIGFNTVVESGVHITGSDEFPTKIGSEVLIKGRTYILGSIIEDNVHIEQCILVRKKVKQIVDKDGVIKPVKYFFPEPEGIEAIKDL